jgi:flavin reductase (DIM6/NTAB) family NADH-FMN oxidoreductase RutF
MDRVRLDPATLPPLDAYRLLTSVLVPRPIAWVATVSEAGVDNLAPFSYFMGVATTPMLVAFSVARDRHGARKDTARNLLAHGGHGAPCTIAVPEVADLERMHATSAPWTGSEFDAVGIGRVPGACVPVPRPAGARVAMEGRVHAHLDLGQVDLFVVEILCVHLDDALWDGVRVRTDSLVPLARLGGEAYAALGARMPRPPARVPED